MRRTLTLVGTLLAVAGVASANNLKNKLVQQKAKDLAESAVMNYNLDDDCQAPIYQPPVISVPDCNCTLTQLPGLGVGIVEGFSQQAVTYQEANLQSVPDTQYT